MKTILVTGCAGFLGSNTVSKLLNRGDKVIGIDDFNDYYNPELKRYNVGLFSGNPNFTLIEMNILNSKKIGKVVRETGVDHIIHFAARAGIRASLTKPLLYLKTNLLGTLQVLKMAHKYPISNALIISSSSVYGKTTTIPFTEDDVCITPQSPYAVSKRSAELLAYNYHDLYGMNISVIRPFTVYGPSGRPDMAPALFTHLIDKGLPITLYGDGSAKRDFTYVDDFTDGVLKVLDHPVGFEIYNIGHSHPETVKKLIGYIEQFLGKSAVIDEQPVRPDEMKQTYANIDKMSALGYSPTVSLEEGMKRYVAWYKEFGKRFW